MGKRLNTLVLLPEEQTTLEALLRKGKQSVRQLKRAQILLQLHSGKQPMVIAEAVGVSLATVYNVHGRYLQEKLGALQEKSRSAAQSDTRSRSSCHTHRLQPGTGGPLPLDGFFDK